MTSTLALFGGTPVRAEPFRLWPVIDGTDEAALVAALRSGQWSRWHGENTRRFEREFADYVGTRFALAVSSGTGALEVAMRALGLGPSDEVIAPAYSFTAPIAAILATGASPVLVDVDPRSFCLDPVAVERAITGRTRAILALHLGGTPCDMTRLLEIARSSNLLVVEDAALALGSRFDDRPLGSLGTVGIFSFQAEKNLASGEGGAIVTDLESTWIRSVELHDYWKGQVIPHIGWTERSLSYRISDLLSALLIAQLRRVEEQSIRRSRHGERLDARLAQIPGFHPVRPPVGTTRNTRSLYMLRYESAEFSGVTRERLIEALTAEGIPALAGYARPIFANPIFQSETSGYAQLPIPGPRLVPAPCPAAEALCAGNALWLRQQTLLCSDAEVEQIADAFEKVYESRRALA